MDLRIVGKQPLSGEVQIPADKSITHRSIMLASLSNGTTLIDAPGAGADNDSTAELFRSLGIAIERQRDGWLVHGNGLDGLKETSRSSTVATVEPPFDWSRVSWLAPVCTPNSRVTTRCASVPWGVSQNLCVRWAPRLKAR